MKDTTRRVITIPPKAELSTGQGNKRQLRVAAYCRFSTDDEEQLTSDAVQAEMARRKAARSPSQKSSSTGLTSYAGKYALSERLICGECGTPKPADPAVWKCPACGHENTGKFCSECGQPKPADSAEWKCPACGHEGNKGKFCSECGQPRP